MAKIPLKLEELIDGEALRRDLTALTAETGGDGSSLDVRGGVLQLLKERRASGRAVAERMLREDGGGTACAARLSHLMDEIIRALYDFAATHVYHARNPSSAERMAVVAVGGYGRGTLAPGSDLDLLFLLPYKQTPWGEQVVEYMLYMLWDMGLKVGHATRNIDECLRLSREDITIRTAILDARFLWGEEKLFDELLVRFDRSVVKHTGPEFVQAKLAERDERHAKAGESRYLVEPNVKDGKGGLRDLQTLYWIGKYIHRVRSAAELVDVGLFTPEEYASFRRAEGFMLAVRCHLHTITRRAEDRLTFDLQREVARRMNYRDRPGKSAVERFMQFYFLQAQHVGHLTGVFLAHIDEQMAGRRRPRGLLAGFRSRPRMFKGYRVVGGRICAPGDDWFRQEPARLIEVFQLAEQEGLEIHPETMRMARRDSVLIKDAVRREPRANELFMKLLTGHNDPETVLRWMNEAGVFGRFIPDFGKVNAQMQFDMYHHYTVDEHTIRAIGLLAQIERGELAEDHPLATEIVPQLASRRVLYVATLLHDIAKGRGGDHSVLGAEIALKLCPRLGMEPSETELVSWLVRYHLLMSATAFKRDLSDPKTITDFVEQVQTIERLRQLMVLTVVDIRAVGPGIWNSWKRQLLADLYELAEERIRLGHKRHGRKERIDAKKVRVAQFLGSEAHLLDEVEDRFDDAYWIAEPEDIVALNIRQYAGAKAREDKLSIHAQYYPARGATLVTVIGDDHPGLFFRIAGAIHLAGANIIDARIHTTRVGKAVDNFLVQDPLGKPFREADQLARLQKSIEDALAGRVDLVPSLARRPLARARAESFEVRPQVLFDNQASGRFTVIEVNARDRPALLNRLAHALFANRLMVNSAHITQYGERAVDTFYVTDLLGGKVTSKDRLKQIEQALLEAAAEPEPVAA